tara:strand:- start:712 stop:1074 length:363 start_codon:yes stop_codon:yes gene_type:complete
MKRILLTCFFIIILNGCSTAQKSSEVNSVRVPISPYLKLNCQELASEQSILLSQAEAARAAVDSAYQSDKSAELVAWILFAPAAFMIDGNQEEAAKLANIKGQLEAIQEAQKVNQCISVN